MVFWIYTNIKKWTHQYNRPVAQIPQCISPVSHDGSLCNRNVHICVHVSVTKRCIVGWLMHYGIYGMDLWENRHISENNHCTIHQQQYQISILWKSKLTGLDILKPLHCIWGFEISSCSWCWYRLLWPFLVNIRSCLSTIACSSWIFQFSRCWLGQPSTVLSKDESPHTCYTCTLCFFTLNGNL